jgi:hypothetical protein
VVENDVTIQEEDEKNAVDMLFATDKEEDSFCFDYQSEDENLSNILSYAREWWINNGEKLAF